MRTRLQPRENGMAADDTDDTAQVVIRHLDPPADGAAVLDINAAAFGKDAGPAAMTFHNLRLQADDVVSLDAEADAELVGHAFFCPASIECDTGVIEGMGLGELAVRPAWQRRGIGGRLTLRGFEILRDGSCPFVIVIGHAAYYPRLGFEPGSAHGLRCQWDGVPAENFMVKILDADRMRAVTGVARYRDV